MRSLLPLLSILLSLAAISLSQTIPSLAVLLGSYPELSNLSAIGRTFPDIVATIRTASNFTLLAPSNKAFTDAFSTLPASLVNDSTYVEALLKYHIINGTYTTSDFAKVPKFLHATLLDDKRFSNLSSNEPQVVDASLVDSHACFYSGLKQASIVSKANLNFIGGVLHIIDKLLTLPQNVSTTAIAANLTAVAGALGHAGLVDAVDSLQSVTIFAPSNGAFQAIGNLVPKLSKTQLTDILTYHVVPARALSVGVTNGQKVKTLQGGELTIRINNGSIFVNGAKVILTDVITNNGVVHVIDGVLNPNATNHEPNTGASTQAPAFPSATYSPDVPFTSGISKPTSSNTSNTTTSPSASSTGGGQKSAASCSKSNVATAVVGAALAFAAGMIV